MCVVEDKTKLTCRICLSIFDHGESQMNPIEEDAGHDPLPQETLWHKIQALGFFQVQKGHLCSWCAGRVEDAYELKQQCLKANRAFGDDEANFESVKRCAILDTLREAVRLEMDSASSVTRNHRPGLAKIAPRSCLAVSTISLILAGAHDMLTCVQKLSSSLRLISAFLASALHFTENTIALLAVLPSLKEESAAVKKSAETIRKEAELWKIKSSMIEDASSFVKDVSNHNLLWKKQHSKSCKTTPQVSEAEVVEESVTLVPTNTSSKEVSNVISVMPVGHVISSEAKLSPDSSSAACSSTVQQDRNINCDALKVDNNASLESQSVRRSFRNKSEVNHLVYLPSSKRHGSMNGKLSAPKVKSSQKSSSSAATSVTALNRLLLKRNVDSESENVSNEKWAIVKKRKLSNGFKSRKKRSIEIEAQTSSCAPNPMDVSSQIKNKGLSPDRKEKNDEDEEMKSGDDKDSEEDDVNVDSNQNQGPAGPAASASKTCSISGRTLRNKRNYKAHIKMHIESSSFQCKYCRKLFSSRWNRSQHERVHTGEKPYTCDVCLLSFRYNVSMRQHKLKSHGTV